MAPSDGGKSATIDISQLSKNAEELAQVQQALAAAGGNEKAGKEALLRELVSANTEKTTPLVEQLQKVIDPADPGLKAAVIEAVSAYFDELRASVDEFVGAEYAKRAEGSKGDVEALKEREKKLIEKDRALRTILETFDIDVSEVPEPKRRGGRPAGSGGGGSKATGANRENYRYLMDGKARPASQNSFSSLAYYATQGCPKAAGEPNATEKDRWGGEQLKSFLATQGVKFGEDNEWSAKLPNGKTVGARRASKESMLPEDLKDLGLDQKAETSAESTPTEATASPNPEPAAAGAPTA